MNTIEVVQNFLGDSLTVSSAQSLAEIPLEQLMLLFEELAPLYYDWLENEEKRREDETVEIYHCLDPYPKKLPWRDKIDRYKGLLLYFPRITIPDPVGEMIWPMVTVAFFKREMGELPVVTIPNEEEFRSDLKAALSLLAELSPLVNTQEITLIPSTFALDYEVVQNSARKEMNVLSKKELASYRSTKHEIGAVKVWGRICAMCDLTPVAGKSWVHQILEAEYQLSRRKLKHAAGVKTRMAQNLLQQKVPGVSQASLRDIISLRRSEEAFRDFSKSFSEVLDRVHRESPVDETQFKVEFREAVETLLTPRIEDINTKIKASPVLTTIFISAALILGGGVITYMLTHTWPLGTGVSASLIPVSWIVDKIHKRFNKVGRKGALLRQFYGYLIESSQ